MRKTLLRVLRRVGAFFTWLSEEIENSLENEYEYESGLVFGIKSCQRRK